MDWSTTWLAQIQPRKASNSAGKRRKVLKIPKTAGVYFLFKQHPRVLLDSLQMIKKQFNLHQLCLELALRDHPNHFSPAAPNTMGLKGRQHPLLRHLLAACPAEDSLPDPTIRTNLEKGRGTLLCGRAERTRAFLVKAVRYFGHQTNRMTQVLLPHRSTGC